MKERWGTMLPEPEAVALLAEYGIAYPAYAYVQSTAEAAAAAGLIGYPVVLKVVSPDAVHKSDVGGVVLAIADAHGVAPAYEAIVRSVRAHVADAEIQGMLVCRQAPPGLDMIVGGLQDAMFGPALMFGLGGIFAELLEDVAFRIVPIKEADAREMIQEIRGYSLLTGMRGTARCDVEALVGLLLSVSRMMVEHTEIRELDLNPVRVYEQGLMTLDARIVLARSE